MLTARAFARMGLALAVVAAAGCTEAKRASQTVAFEDKPADVTCWSHGVQIYSGKSTGKVRDRRSDRVGFVDAATGRYTTIDGDCLIVYEK